MKNGIPNKCDVFYQGRHKCRLIPSLLSSLDLIRLWLATQEEDLYHWRTWICRGGSFSCWGACHVSLLMKHSKTRNFLGGKRLLSMTHLFRNANTAVDKNTKDDMKQDGPAVLIDGNAKSSCLTK